MAIILKEDKSLSFEVSYVKYIKVNDMMEFYCSLMSRNIQINEGSDDLMEVATIITPFTKTKELLSFKKISLLGKYLLTKYDENEVIFNDNFVDKWQGIIEKFDLDVNINRQFDLLNILNILFEIEQDNLITKKILKAFTTLLKEGDIIIIFNSDYLTRDIIEILNSKCVQTLIIFNTPGNIKDTISNNIENLILQTKDFFKMSDNKTIDDEWQNTGSIEIIKI